jgi:hypothetical protein
VSTPLAACIDGGMGVTLDLVGHIYLVESALSRAVSTTPSHVQLSILIHITSGHFESFQRGEAESTATSSQSGHGGDIVGGAQQTREEKVIEEKQITLSQGFPPSMLASGVVTIQDGRPDLDAILLAEARAASREMSVCGTFILSGPFYNGPRASQLHLDLEQYVARSR